MRMLLYLWSLSEDIECRECSDGERRPLEIDHLGDIQCRVTRCASQCRAAQDELHKKVSRGIKFNRGNSRPEPLALVLLDLLPMFIVLRLLIQQCKAVWEASDYESHSVSHRISFSSQDRVFVSQDPSGTAADFRRRPNSGL